MFGVKVFFYDTWSVLYIYIYIYIYIYNICDFSYFFKVFHKISIKWILIPRGISKFF